MKALLSLVFLGIVAISPAAHAVVVLEELKPYTIENEQFGWDIRSERLPNGPIQFTVTISLKLQKYPVEVGGTSLDYLSPGSQVGSQGDHLIRPLPSERKVDTIKCVFTVSDKELGDPNTCFALGWRTPSPIVSSATVFYASLKNFTPK